MVDKYSLNYKFKLKNTKSTVLIKYVPDRLGHDKRYAIDSSKIENKLNWKPKVKFDDGLARTINWYLKNKKWWEKLVQN